MEKNMILKERVYTAEAAETIGISKATLLRWFAEGKVPEVARDVRGWRVFTKREIDRIRQYANTIQTPTQQRSKINAR